ncbi:hypothetical protein IJ732_04205 [bacterium]|nr:hypothetical protein [bacterium]
MNFNETVETEILSVLKSNFLDFDVENFPVNIDNYHFTSSKGCFLVKFLSTEFLEQNTIWEVNQETNVTFEIISIYRGMDNYSQIHYPQENLKQILQGFEISGRKITLVKEEFLKEVNTDLFCKLTCKIKFPQNESD